MVIDGAAPIVDPAPSSGRLGGVDNAIADWTQGWTYGIHDGSRAVKLWFEE